MLLISYFIRLLLWPVLVKYGYFEVASIFHFWWEHYLFSHDADLFLYDNFLGMTAVVLLTTWITLWAAQCHFFIAVHLSYEFVIELRFMLVFYHLSSYGWRNSFAFGHTCQLSCHLSRWSYWAKPQILHRGCWPLLLLAARSGLGTFFMARRFL